MLRLLRFWRMGGNDLRLLWFALRHPNRPAWLLAALSALLLYAIEPLNFAIPLLGILDDVFLFPLIVHWLAKLLPADIQFDFGRARSRDR
jgi:uncharacterized membrane protein YkvA (DUF1232 family)